MKVLSGIIGSIVLLLTKAFPHGQGPIKSR